MRNDPRTVLPLLGVALITGCAETEPLPDPPTQAQLDACNTEDFGAEDFDWSCCEVWAQECRSEGRGEECDWICNG